MPCFELIAPVIESLRHFRDRDGAEHVKKVQEDLGHRPLDY